LCVIVIAFTTCACKKCMTCSTLCYACDHHSQGVNIDTICSDGIRSVSIINQVIEHYQNDGYICTKMKPSQTFEYCDNNKQLVNYLQTTGLICQ
jgi:hypothetical protein